MPSRPRVVLRARAAVVAMVVIAAIAGAVAPVAADPPPTDAEALQALAAQIASNEHHIVELSGEIDAATSRLAELAQAIVQTQQQIDATRAEIERLKTILRSRAAFIYRQAKGPTIALGDVQHVEDLAAGTKYVESATRTDDAQIERLSRAAAALDAQRQELDHEQQQATQQRTLLVAAKDALEAATARQKKLLDAAGAISVMGDSQLTADQVSAWFESTHRHYQLAGGTTIEQLVQIYMDEGKAEHVRPELAFAQSIIETGSFGHALDNNYSGIGACDTCNGEPAFPTPRDGVRGQMQLLRNYADPKVRASDLADPPSPTIWGSDPVAAAATYNSFSFKGRAPTWNLMGNGNWATDPNYAGKVLTVYFEMLAFTAHNL
jgi:hypothetical protein